MRTTTVLELLQDGGLPRAESLTLLSHAAGRRREQLLAGPDDAVDPAAAIFYRNLVQRRSSGEPISYLVGCREFYGHSFRVDPRVLIPRPETELLVDQALERIDRHGATQIVDLGTGSGAIALSIALERPAVIVTATDASDRALAVARENAERLGARVTFAEGDWCDALPDGVRYDVIVSNPPYIALGDPHLADGDLRFEPRSALTDGHDGLAAIRRIVTDAPRFLATDGCLMLEHGAGQAADVRRLLTAAAFDSVLSFRDLAGIERVACGTWRAGSDVADGAL